MRYWKERLLSYLAYLTIILIGKTLRIKYINMGVLDGLRTSEENVILAIWHGRQFLFAYGFRGQGILTMTSLSRDGEIQTGILRLLGFSPIRGSSSKGGRRALRELLSRIREKRDVVFAVDGPQGPVHTVKPGVIYTARKSSMRILPVSTSSQKKKIFTRSWDRYLLPMPFSRSIVIVGDPIAVREDDDIGEKCKELAYSLDALSDRADILAGG